ncbi:MAG: ImmA/IrrE family metallo-endopeptidase [Methanosarcinales archaeon]|jgi:Zn-dependent peptidase ImmA (M78 family)|nr:ImmA/IrrE family metallo-endopeptidase [Methanosarcinales archaeon]
MRSNADLNKKALRLRKEFEIDSTSPVNIFPLIENLDSMTVIRYPFSNNISGASIKIDSEKIISINSTHSYGRQRFTAAHELYHLFVEEENMVVCEDLKWEQKPDSEKEADIFASYFLAPNEVLKQFIKKNQNRKTDNLTIEEIIEIQQYFQISHKATLYRLKNDGYSYDKELWDVKIADYIKKMEYSKALYLPNSKIKQYSTIGNYIKKAEEVKNKKIISQGKYEELLREAFIYD